MKKFNSKFKVNYKVEKYVPGAPIWEESKTKYFKNREAAERFVSKIVNKKQLKEINEPFNKVIEL